MASETDICNMALGRLGAERIVSIDDTASVPAQRCRLHYDQTRDALLRSYNWTFAKGRETLVAEDETPDFEYDFQYILPADFLAMVSPYEGVPFNENIHTFSIEGKRFLTNETTVELRFIKKIVDTTKFDPLFVEVLVLRLALKILPSVAGGDTPLAKSVGVELLDAESRARTVNGQEANSIGIGDLRTWNNARF